MKLYLAVIVTLALGCGPEPEPAEDCAGTVMHPTGILPGGECEEVCAIGLYEIQDYRNIGYVAGECPAE